MKRERSECLKGVGTATASKMHLMNNPDFFGRNGISMELAERMGLKPYYNREGFFIGFHRADSAFEIKVTSIERWKNELKKAQSWQNESNRIIVNYLKGQRVSEQ